jgi:hypothetical protein
MNRVIVHVGNLKVSLPMKESGAHRRTTAGPFLPGDRSRAQTVASETRDWEQTAVIIARFFEVKAEDLV